jgi:hypothetical protein
MLHAFILRILVNPVHAFSNEQNIKTQPVAGFFSIDLCNPDLHGNPARICDSGSAQASNGVAA